MLHVRPCTVKKALPFVARVHRRLPKVQGAMWAVGAYAHGELIGVAIVGWPARALKDDTLAVLRVAVTTDPSRQSAQGYRNACSLLYGACARAGKAMGAENMVTYLHGGWSSLRILALQCQASTDGHMRKDRVGSAECRKNALHGCVACGPSSAYTARSQACGHWLLRAASQVGRSR